MADSLPCLQKQRKGVRRMDDYQILMILLTIAGLLLAAYKAGKDDR